MEAYRGCVQGGSEEELRQPERGVRPVEGRERCERPDTRDGGLYERGGLGLYQRRRFGGGREGGDRHQGGAALHDSEVRRRVPVQHHGLGYHHGAYAPLRS